MPAWGQNANDQYEFSIKGGALGRAVESVRDLTNIEFLYSFDLVNVDGIKPVNGRYTVSEALEIMLQGTGLSGGLTERGMIVITRDNSAKALDGENTEVNVNLKKSLLVGAAAAAVTLGQQNALAQETADAPEVTQEESRVLDTVVVTGIKASLENAVNTKRNSSVIADVIGSTGLGRFPDENVAESLQRVTGVQIQRFRGEGSQVSIRGLPPIFTQATLNGRPLASAIQRDVFSGLSRSFEFSSLPSEFVSSLEVHKTPAASLQEGGLAGTVIVRTPSPLDIGERQISLSAQAAHESNSGKIAPRVAGLYSDVFADGKIGVALGAAYTERNAETHSQLSRGFRKSRDYTHNIILPERYRDENKRLSLLGKVEWQPIEDLRLFADVFYSDIQNEAERSAGAYNFGLTQGRAASGDNPDISVVESGTNQELISGIPITTRAEFTGLELRTAGNFQELDGSTTAFSTGGGYTKGPWTFDGELNFSSSEQKSDGLRLINSSFISQAGYDATVDDEVTSVILNDQALSEALDPNNYRLLALFGPFNSEAEDSIAGGKFNIAREFDTDMPMTFKFGGWYSKQEQDFTPRNLAIDRADAAALLGLPEVEPGAFNAASVVELVEAGGGSFLDSYDGGASLPQFLGTSARRAIQGLDREQLLAASSVSSNLASIIDVEETIAAVYGQLDFASVDDRLLGNIGVRVVSTEQTTVGNSPDLDGITFQPDQGVLITIPPSGAVAISRDYLDILPSANLQISLTDDIVTRFAASRTMARPNLGQISPSATASATPPTINQNNPFLDPFEANNFDLALEWYFDEGSLLSATLFYKDLVSLVENESENRDLIITEISGDGSTRPITEEFIINSVQNGDGATLEGVELSLQHNFSSLPGLLANTGAQVNYTYINNSDQEKIVGASANNFNVSGFYEADNLALRLSYTWRDRYLVNPNAQENLGQFIESGGILDGNVTYDINDNFSLVVEAINLLDTPRPSTDGNGFAAVYEDNGRRLLFGGRARF